MRALSAVDIMRLWEHGDREGPVEHALSMLIACGAGGSRAELAGLPLGARDARLLRLRELTFGGELRFLVGCPACGKRLELGASTAALQSPEEPSPELGPPLDLPEDGLRARVRPATSEDLAAAARTRSTEAARRCLVERCVTREDGAPLDAGALSEAAFTRISERMAEADPQAEILFSLACPECGHTWSALFDVPAFLAREIGAAARRLLTEVDTLARTYHWREADILAMGSRRRRAYLEKVGE